MLIIVQDHDGVRFTPPSGHSAYGPSGYVDIIEMVGAVDNLIALYNNIF